MAIDKPHCFLAVMYRRVSHRIRHDHFTVTVNFYVVFVPIVRFIILLRPSGLDNFITLFYYTLTLFETWFLEVP